MVASGIDADDTAGRHDATQVGGRGNLREITAAIAYSELRCAEQDGMCSVFGSTKMSAMQHLGLRRTFVGRKATGDVKRSREEAQTLM